MDRLFFAASAPRSVGMLGVQSNRRKPHISPMLVQGLNRSSFGQRTGSPFS
jgi:hypothetical protein